jgi:hypothetical protein
MKVLMWLAFCSCRRSSCRIRCWLCFLYSRSLLTSALSSMFCLFTFRMSSTSIVTRVFSMKSCWASAPSPSPPAATLWGRGAPALGAGADVTGRCCLLL